MLAVVVTEIVAPSVTLAGEVKVLPPWDTLIVPLVGVDHERVYNRVKFAVRVTSFVPIVNVVEALLELAIVGLPVAVHPLNTYPEAGVAVMLSWSP